MKQETWKEIEKEEWKAAKALYAPGPDTPEAVATSERYYHAAKLASPLKDVVRCKSI